METPTAVAVSHGGQILVVYDATNEVTDVAALDGEVEVKGTLGVIGPGVTVSPQERTQVRKGRFPSAPSQSAPDALERDTEGLDVLGTGSDQGVGGGHPAMSARVLRPEDLPQAIAPVARGEEKSGGESKARFPLPAETLAERLSPDVRAQSQPIPEFGTAAPGEPPSGGVDVDF